MAEVLQAAMPAPGWRLKLGVALFVLSILIPLLGLSLVAGLGLPASNVAAISGAILVGGEVLAIVAVAVMGKSGYTYIKNRVFRFLKQFGPPAEVSRRRYTVGLVMFTLPIVFGWVAPYEPGMIPGYLGNESTYAIVGDFLLLASLFVLGGDFWDKLRALFFHEAKAVFLKTPG